MVILRISLGANSENLYWVSSETYFPPCADYSVTGIFSIYKCGVKIAIVIVDDVK